MTREEAIEIVAEAQEQLLEAVDKLAHVAREMKDAHAEDYIISHLQCLASDEHRYLSRDYNVTQWLRDLENGDEDADEE